jgi:hypothetical protein
VPSKWILFPEIFVADLFNRIEQDHAVAADEYGDHRRIAHLYMTLADKRPPIHFLHPRQPNESDNDEGAT